MKWAKGDGGAAWELIKDGEVRARMWRMDLARPRLWSVHLLPFHGEPAESGITAGSEASVKRRLETVVRRIDLAAQRGKR